MFNVKSGMKLTAALLATALLLFGCSGNTKEPAVSGKETSPSAQPSSSASPTEETIDINQKYEPPIEVTTTRIIPNPSIVKYPEGDSLEQNVWTRELEEKLGIRIKNLWAVDTSQYAQKTNVMIASGTLPDFFMVNSGSQLKQLYDADLIADVSEVFDKYASEQVKAVYAEGGPEDLATARIDGKLMAIPFLAMAKEGTKSIFWVRTDWLKKLNLPEPKTMDDILAISEAFSKRDPDGNGKPDTFGLAADGELSWLDGFFNSYHAYPRIWVNGADGKLAYGSIQPEMKTVLGVLQRLYKDGQIDKEFVTKNYTQLYEPLGAGKYGLVYGPYYISIAPLQSIRTADNTADWKAFPIISADDKPALAQHGIGVSGYWVVNKKAKNPEAVVKMLNHWYESFYFNTSKESYAKLINSEAYISIYSNAPIQSYRAFANLETSEAIAKVFAGELKEDDLMPDKRAIYDYVKRFRDGDESMWGWERSSGPDSAIFVVKHYKDNNLFYGDKFYGTATETMAKKSQSLYAMETETFAKIIMGEPLDKFDEFVENWKKLGGQDITSEVNEWFSQQ